MPGRIGQADHRGSGRFVGRCDVGYANKAHHVVDYEKRRTGDGPGCSKDLTFTITSTERSVCARGSTPGRSVLQGLWWRSAPRGPVPVISSGPASPRRVPGAPSSEETPSLIGASLSARTTCTLLVPLEPCSCDPKSGGLPTARVREVVAPGHCQREGRRGRRCRENEDVLSRVGSGLWPRNDHVDPVAGDYVATVRVGQRDGEASFHQGPNQPGPGGSVCLGYRFTGDDRHCGGPPNDLSGGEQACDHGGVGCCIVTILKSAAVSSAPAATDRAAIGTERVADCPRSTARTATAAITARTRDNKCPA